MKSFINLNRSFELIPKDIKFNEDEHDLSVLFGLSTPKKWDDLLKLHRVIILAEAGAGKTEEMRATTERLRNDGKKAFFFRLEYLSSEFEASFDIGNDTEFNEWLDSDDLGWFFLDSVDEARLSGPKQFESAIRKFGNKLGNCKERAYVYITSRFSEWRAQADLSLIKDRIPYREMVTPIKKPGEDNLYDKKEASNVATAHVSKGERKPIEPSLFVLRPLDQDQIRTFSQADSIQDIDAFLASIERAEADIFSRRPQDLIELINYWKQYGKIANRLKMIEASTSSKLKETDPDRAAALPLNFDDAMYGVEMLAAAVTFLKKNRILIPEQNADFAIKTEAIDIQAVLTNWEPKKTQALLQRPIFDEAIYGSVRFHHRSVREYLTAKWLHRLLLKEKPRRTIENLFFTERYGVSVLVPSMRPILAWLILFDDQTRQKTADLAPEVLIQGGDPSALPVDIRKHLLESFCAHYAEKKIAHLSFDISELRRFANPDLADTINSLLETYSSQTELCDLLLRIVWQGEIQGCSEKALAFALDDKKGIYTRINGIRAIEVAGSDDQKNKLVNGFIADPTIENEELIAELITSFAPEILPIQNVLRLIQRIKKSEARTYSWLSQALEEFCRYKCPEIGLIDWIVGILPLLKQPPFIERRFFEVSKQYSWLLHCSTLAAERLVLIKHTSALDKRVLETISLAQAARSFGDYHSGQHALIELVPKWSELNRALFWFDVESKRRRLDRNEERLTEWWQVRGSYHYWRFKKEDFGKALEDINVRSDMDDRMVALSLAFQIYAENGRGRERRLALKKVVHGVPEMEEALNLYFKPPPMTDENRRWKRSDAHYKRRQKQQEKKESDNRRKWCEWLKANTSVLRDTRIAPEGKIWNATSHLLNELMNKKSNSSKRAKPHWENLIAEFGQDVAEAYRDGCIDYWRKYRPAIRSEGIENPNSTPNSVIVGLSGLEIEVRQNPDWPNNLSKDEAKLAFRYAVNEMNGFPKWLPKLHCAFPDIVETGILVEIEWEFSQYDSEAPCYYVLDDVVWQADWLKPKISNKILSFLKDYEPKHHDPVKKALGIVLADPDIDKETLIKIAKSKLLTMMPTNKQVLWLAAWMSIDAKAAFETLRSTLGQIDNAEQATKFSMLFIVELLGESRLNIRGKYQDHIQPEILLSLLKLMHTYIHRSEDINRTSGVVYSSTLREDSQETRNKLFQLLSDIPGKPTYIAMLDFAQCQTDIEYRKRYEMYAKRHAEADAEFESWQPGDIACFSEETERAPQNHRELLNMAVSRLLDLKAYLEDGDTSIADMIQSVRDEPKTRNYIGGWLREKSLGRYSVPQEEELADGKKPDIRMHGVGFDAPVPIELKIADNWSAVKHVERLNNQLVGQYLRDRRSNCGIFLLVYCGKRTFWKHPNDGKKLDFIGLIGILKEGAKEIIDKDNKIESIEIVGIDLTKRNTKKALVVKR